VYYTQKDSDAADASAWLSQSLLPQSQDRMACPKSGLKPESATVGGLLKDVGDYCFYNYDLGDCWIHSTYGGEGIIRGRIRWKD